VLLDSEENNIGLSRLGDGAVVKRIWPDEGISKDGCGQSSSPGRLAGAFLLLIGRKVVGSCLAEMAKRPALAANHLRVAGY